MRAATWIGVCMAVVLGVGVVAQGYIVADVSAPTPVTDPFTGVLLDSYTVSLTATGVGETVTAVDIRFDSASRKLHQLAFYGCFWTKHYLPTPMNNMPAEGWPAEYIAADSHFLIASADAVWPTGKAASEDMSESYLPRDGYDIWHSWGTYLKSDPMGLAHTVQASVVQLARIVIPRDSLPGTVLMTGIVESIWTDPYQDIGVILIPPIPEPGTIVLLALGGLAFVRRRR